MEGLEFCTRLERLNGVPCNGLIAGSLGELQLAGHKAEDGFALSFVRYLPRSASSLATIDMRYTQNSYHHHLKCSFHSRSIIRKLKICWLWIWGK